MLPNLDVEESCSFPIWHRMPVRLLSPLPRFVCEPKYASFPRQTMPLLHDSWLVIPIPHPHLSINYHFFTMRSDWVMENGSPHDRHFLSVVRWFTKVRLRLVMSSCTIGRLPHRHIAIPVWNSGENESNEPYVFLSRPFSLSRKLQCSWTQVLEGSGLFFMLLNVRSRMAAL